MYFPPFLLQRMRHIHRLLQQLQPEQAARSIVIPGSSYPHEHVIVFTGSFNPPTSAHLALLQQAQRFARQRGKVQLYAAFSKRTVDKEEVERPLLLERIVLLHGVLKRRLPQTGILLFNRGLYVEQAEALRVSFPHVRRIYFLMGFDKIVQIFDPHYYEDRDASLQALFQQAELLVAPRGNASDAALTTLLGQSQNRRFAAFVHALPFSPAYKDVSSTLVRQAGYVRDVPQEVRKFMRETRAYLPPLRRADGSEVDVYAQHVRDLATHLVQSPASGSLQRADHRAPHFHTILDTIPNKPVI